MSTDSGEDLSAYIPDGPLTGGEDPSLGSISGRVYDKATKEALSGVEVRLQRDGAESDKNVASVTDEEGHYRFVNLQDGSYVVKRAWVDTGLPRPKDNETLHMRIRRGRSFEGADIAVEMGIRIAGRVADTQGQPVVGAVVQARDRATRGSLQTCTSDGEGRFAIFGIQQTTQLTVQAELRHSPYFVSELYGPARLTSEGLYGLTLTLQPTGSVSGKVTDPRGRPLGGVSVIPMFPPSTPKGILRANGDPTAANGAFRVERVPGGRFDLGLAVPGNNLIKMAVAPNNYVELQHGEDITGLVLVLESEDGYVIAGRITDHRGQPVNTASLYCSSPQGYGSGDSNDTGEYRIFVAQDGLYSLSVEHAELANVQLQEVSAGDEHVDIVLAPMGAIEGAVLDGASGKPIKAFELLHVDDYNRRYEGVRDHFRHYEDPEGGFHIQPVEPGPVTVIAKAEGYAERAVEIERVVSGETLRGVKVLMAAGLSLRGKVLDKAGRPVEGAGIVPGKLPHASSPEIAVATRSDESGAFELRGLSVSMREVSVWHPDFAEILVPVKLQAGRVNSVTVVLTPGGIVEGRLFLEGKPWAGREVSYFGPTGSRGEGNGDASLKATTSAEGRFRFDKLMAGSGMILVSVPAED